MMTLPVVETFGPTIQGEGPYAGRLTHFLRLGNCNLHCTWCDQPETWDTDRFDLSVTITETAVDAIAERLTAARMVVVSGGEPLMWQRRDGWSALLHTLREARTLVHVETNGTIAPTEDTMRCVQHFTVSPKHTDQGDRQAQRIKPDVIEAFAALAEYKMACFKFVCANPAEVDSAAAFVATYGLDARRVWIMPEGTTVDQVIANGRAVAEAAIGHGFNFTTRAHVLLWDDEKAR